MCSKRLRDITESHLWRDVNWQTNTWWLKAMDRQNPSGWLAVEYIVYDAEEADFWKGLKNDLLPKEYELSWESVLHNRWSNLKAVVEKTRKITKRAKFPFHHVWISSQNALNLDNPAKHNPVEEISRLIYGSTLSSRATTSGRPLEPRHLFKTSFQIPSRFGNRSWDLLDKPSQMAGPRSWKYPLASRGQSYRLTDDCSYGLDFCVPPDASELGIPKPYGKAGQIAALCRLAREALQSPNLIMEVLWRNPADVSDWLHAFCDLPKAAVRSPFTLHAKADGAISDETAAGEFWNYIKTLTADVHECMKDAWDSHMDQSTNLPNRLVIQTRTFHDDDLGGPKSMFAEIDMKNSETARALLCATCTADGVTLHGYLDGIMVGAEAFWK